jgi:uncharacterized protein YbaR (Trm112 family)
MKTYLVCALCDSKCMYIDMRREMIVCPACKTEFDIPEDYMEG